jgi:hypothetical protein
MRAIDKLKKAANLELTQRTVRLGNGDEIVMWASNLTMAEREKAQKQAGEAGDANAFAIQLLLQKAKDESGAPLFAPGELAELKHEVEDADLQNLMLAVIQRGEAAGGAAGGAIDPKRATKAA